MSPIGPGEMELTQDNVGVNGAIFIELVVPGRAIMSEPMGRQDIPMEERLEARRRVHEHNGGRASELNYFKGIF